MCLRQSLPLVCLAMATALIRTNACVLHRALLMAVACLSAHGVEWHCFMARAAARPERLRAALLAAHNPVAGGARLLDARAHERLHGQPLLTSRRILAADFALRARSSARLLAWSTLACCC